jgi:hypothetical protein
MQRRFVVGPIVAALLFVWTYALLAAQRGHAEYAVADCRVNGFQPDSKLIPHEHLTIFSDKTYKWADPEGERTGSLDSTPSGQFAYDPATQKFTFSGPLGSWGRARLDHDSLSIYVGYHDARHKLWEMRLDRIPKTTICPIWPLCT